MTIAEQCRSLFDAAAADLGPDLHGFSVLDLCADNLTNVSLSALREAIIASGIATVASARICAQIDGYRTGGSHA